MVLIALARFCNAAARAAASMALAFGSAMSSSCSCRIRDARSSLIWSRRLARKVLCDSAMANGGYHACKREEEERCDARLGSVT